MYHMNATVCPNGMYHMYATVCPNGMYHMYATVCPNGMYHMNATVCPNGMYHMYAMSQRQYHMNAMSQRHVPHERYSMSQWHVPHVRYSMSQRQYHMYATVCPNGMYHMYAMSQWHVPHEHYSMSQRQYHMNATDFVEAVCSLCERPGGDLIVSVQCPTCGVQYLQGTGVPTKASPMLPIVSPGTASEMAVSFWGLEPSMGLCSPLSPRHLKCGREQLMHCFQIRRMPRVPILGT
ncbi:hypothetical protein FKM82_017145 [Ascaphus truei]